MATAMDFHSQIASIMEVLANAAVAEICKVVEDGYAVVNLEISRSKKENETLRRKTKLLELQLARYRAERVKGAEGSAGSRLAGVRLLNRQNRDAGPSLPGRTRCLNRDPETQQSVQKIQPENLHHDADQEVVTTTKTEAADLEEAGQLLIVKVEESMEMVSTNHEAPTDACIGGDAPATTPLLTAPTDTWCRGQTEGQRCNTQHKKETIYEGVPSEKRSPSQIPLRWQESSETNAGLRPSSSTYTAETGAGNSSFIQIKTNVVSSFPDVDQETPKPDVTVINSRPEESGGGELSSERHLNDGAQEVDASVRSRYPSGEMFEGNAAYSGTGSLVDYQQTWTGVHPVDNTTQNPLYQASTNQDQESWSTPSQQPCLPYNCTFCSRRYAHQCQLRIHERVHTGEKPYQCVQCGKRFGQVCSLKRHQMVHTGERPFPCPHCGKQFSTSTNLKVHQSVHTGEKKFHCSKCGKNFSFLSNLIRHQALHTAK